MAIDTGCALVEHGHAWRHVVRLVDLHERLFGVVLHRGSALVHLLLTLHLGFCLLALIRVVYLLLRTNVVLGQVLPVYRHLLARHIRCRPVTTWLLSLHSVQTVIVETWTRYHFRPYCKVVEGLGLLVVDVPKRIGVSTATIPVSSPSSCPHYLPQLSLTRAWLIHEQVLRLAEVVDLLPLSIVVADSPPTLVDILSLLDIVVGLNYIVTASAYQNLLRNA